MSLPVYLRDDVAIEPTVHRFYAWLHSIAPATAALQLRQAQLPILESFARNPAVHLAALKRPEMRGGPFLDLPASAGPRMASLAEELRRDAAASLALAEGLHELGALLQAEGDGSSLEELYARVPEPLKGYVELAYDPEHRAGFRLLEPLLYAGEAYDRSAQRLLLSRLKGDARSFVLSTPRVADEHSVELSLAFDSEPARALFEARDKGRPLEEWVQLCGVGPAERARFEELFTDVAARPQRPSVSEGLRVRYLGHACVLFETPEVTLLIDPLLGYPSAQEPPRLSFADLPERIDYVLITHGHQDHFVLESLLPLRHRIGTLVVPRASGGHVEDPSPALALRAVGFPNVRELDELEQLDLGCEGGGEIVGLPFLGEHGDLRVHAKLAHLVRLGERSFVCAADSANLEPRLYDHVRAAVGRPDILFLGMECEGAPASWLYGSLFRNAPTRSADQSRRLCGSNAERAWALVERLQPRRVCVYAMGQEPWCGFITSIEYEADSTPIVESDALIARCEAQGIAAERLFGLRELT